MPDSQTKKCPMCAEEIKVDAKKCKHCGEMLNNDGHETSLKVESSNTAKKTPYLKALLGCIMMGIMFIVIGVPLSPLIIGVPVFLFGVFCVVASPVLALYMYESKCPLCKGAVRWSGFRHAVKCRHCKQRSLIRDMKLIPMKVA
ncbi:MAG: hypothetical protein PHW10_01555 [Candidatus Peribacteraceae bacterium]|nr:hypothetical protein [Candidatus Peribacteraceae bacterium]